jgi:tetratricopeptide (TPR) repeat protein
MNRLRYRVHCILLPVSVAFLFCVFVSGGCTAVRQGRREVPQGVDTTTAAQADSLARVLYGSVEAQAAAESEMEKGKEDFATGEDLRKLADSLARVETLDTTQAKPRGVINAVRSLFGDTTVLSPASEESARAMTAYRSAAKYFRRAMQLVPQAPDPPLWLAATLDRLHEWTESAKTYQIVLQTRKGEHRLWFNYAYASLQAGNYEAAITGFQKAIDVYKLTEGQEVSLPNQYRIFLADAYTRTYQDGLALATFRSALAFASSSDSAQILKTIEWINWDNGGIRTAECRDEAFLAEHENRFGDARKAYSQGIQVARTQAAREELEWRLALLEYTEFEPTMGLDRMKSLIEKNPNAKQEYRESYGKMCYGYAQQLEEKKDVRTALSYYLQGTKFDWGGQGACFVELARLAANDPAKAVTFGTRALDFSLTKEQLRSAYSILEDAYRQQNNWEMMRKYRQALESLN